MIEELNWFIAILAGVGGIAIATFIWNFIKAPVKIWREERVRRRERWREEQGQDMLASRSIELVHDVISYPNCIESLSGGEKILYRVGVRAIGLKSIDDVDVKIEKMVCAQRFRFNEIRVLPARLRHMFRTDESSSKFTLHPSQSPSEYVDIFEWAPKKLEIRICYDDSIYHQGDFEDAFSIKHKNCRVSLVARGRDISECPYEFHIGILGNGKLEIMPSEQFDLILGLEAEAKFEKELGQRT